ncbi:MAG: molybdenum cofactor guanylyltransferase [Pyrinomonadaceae bacterium]|nr:molybdenum cofactor guanylyltransferase [Pyrinomonadaceae bacterium]
MFNLEAFILAGGKSSRMGRDKALLQLGEDTFVERIARALAAVAGERISIVGARSSEARGSRSLVEDVYRDCGALGGLHAALASAKHDWVIVVACDLPFVTGELFHRLARLRENFQAVVPVQTDNRLQPLSALYRREPCLHKAQELLEAGEFRPRVLIEEVRARRVTSNEWSDLEGAESFFTNVNTPQDFARALESNYNFTVP